MGGRDDGGEERDVIFDPFYLAALPWRLSIDALFFQLLILKSEGLAFGLVGRKKANLKMSEIFVQKDFSSFLGFGPTAIHWHSPGEIGGSRF